MRLTPLEITAIKAATHDVFGPTAVVRLFGSRVRDDLKGGDIDLHVEVDAAHGGFDHKINFQVALWERLGERTIDVVLHDRDQPMAWLDRIATRDGIVL